MTGFHERAKIRENISHGCKAMRGKAPGRVACLEFAEGEKRTAITTDRAVERLPFFPRYFCIVIDTSFSYFSLHKMNGGNTSTALLCRYGMTLDLLFESVNGNIIIRMRNRP